MKSADRRRLLDRKRLDQKLNAGDARISKRIRTRLVRSGRSGKSTEKKLDEAIAIQGRRSLLDSALVASTLPLMSAYGVRGNPVAQNSLTVALGLGVWLVGDEIANWIAGESSGGSHWTAQSTAWALLAPAANVLTGWWLLNERQHERFVTGEVVYRRDARGRPIEGNGRFSDPVLIDVPAPEVAALSSSVARDAILPVAERGADSSTSSIDMESDGASTTDASDADPAADDGEAEVVVDGETEASPDAGSQETASESSAASDDGAGASEDVAVADSLPTVTVDANRDAVLDDASLLHYLMTAEFALDSVIAPDSVAEFANQKVVPAIASLGQVEFAEADPGSVHSPRVGAIYAEVEGRLLRIHVRLMASRPDGHEEVAAEKFGVPNVNSLRVDWAVDTRPESTSTSASD